MIGPIRRTPAGRSITLGGTLLSRLQPAKEPFMKWETPTATDFRYGMEITMYVANR